MVKQPRNSKTLAPWKKSYDKPRQCTKKQRHHFADKGLYSQSYGFFSSHVRTWELDHKNSWVLKIRCFHIVVLEKTLESPLDNMEIKFVNPKGNQPWIFIGSIDAWSWISNNLAIWCEKQTRWKRPWCWEILRTGGVGGNKGWDGWMASPTQWTWIWESSGRWWRTRKPGMPQSMGLQSWTWLGDWTTAKCVEWERTIHKTAWTPCNLSEICRCLATYQSESHLVGLKYSLKGSYFSNLSDYALELSQWSLDYTTSRSGMDLRIWTTNKFPGEAGAVLRKPCFQIASLYSPLLISENKIRQMWFSKVFPIPELPWGEFSFPPPVRVTAFLSVALIGYLNGNLFDKTCSVPIPNMFESQDTIIGRFLSSLQTLTFDKYLWLGNKELEHLFIVISWYRANTIECHEY